MMILNTAFDDFVVGEVMGLMAQSEWHHQYSVEDMNRVIVPAVYHDRARCYFDADSEELVGFITWTFLTPEAEEGYVDGTRLLQPEDWTTQPEDGNLWIIDWVAPHGGVMEMARSTKRWFEIHFEGHCREAFFKRGPKNNRIGRVTSSATVH